MVGPKEGSAAEWRVSGNGTIFAWYARSERVRVGVEIVGGADVASMGVCAAIPYL